MFLEDEALVGMAKQAIEQGVNAEKGWMDAVDYYAQMMEQIPDETLSARAADIRDVGQRVLSHLLGVKLKQKELSEPSIVVAVDLLPSDTVSLNKDFVLAFCTAEGGPTSHTAVPPKLLVFQPLSDWVRTFLSCLKEPWCWLMEPKAWLSLIQTKKPK